MGKIKKSKETTKPAKSELTKVSNKKTLKAKKIVKPKKLEKKIKSPTQKLEKSTTGKKKSKGPTPEVEQQYKKAVDALLQYDEKDNGKDLFTRDRPIFLQVDAIKIPICPNRLIRIMLKHTLLTDKQEVCLIVPDLRRGRKIDHEPTIEHYEELLRGQNIKTIKRIIPMRQLRVEYDQFELKRRLCGYYDYFLVDGKVSGHAYHLLGKIFHEKRKTPVPLSLDAPNLAETIENSLKKVILHIHPKGASFIVQFGHTEMTADQLSENLKEVANKLVTDFPGGWANIKSLHVKTARSIAIPVYYTLKSPNTVNVPVVKPSRPKHFEKVSGELTTKLYGNQNVTVHPGGKVDYKKRSTGVSNNQLRKVRQGLIQKKGALMRQKLQKLKAKKTKLKLKLKNKNVESLETKPKLEIGETVAKKQKKNKKKNKRPLSKAPIKQEIKTETPKVDQSQTVKQITSKAQTNKQKKAKKQQKKKPAGQNTSTKTTNKIKKQKVKKVKAQKKQIVKAA